MAGRTALDLQYDLLGRKIAINHIDTGLRKYLYDAEGKIIWEENAKGEIVYCDYDELSRLTTIKYSDPAAAPEEEYHYDVDTTSHAGETF